MSAYLQAFKSKEDIAKEFTEYGDKEGYVQLLRELRRSKIYIAWYGYGAYCGAAFVLFERDGKLYEVNASHCSCYGLEDGWKPEETSWKALAYILEKGTKFDNEYDGYQEAETILRKLVSRKLKS